MPRSVEVLSHWHTLFDNFTTSTLEFYASVEEKLRARQVTDISYHRKDWHEGGILSAKREYLRVARGRLTFEICGAPYGTGFFFSWWLTKQPPKYAMLIGCGVMVGAPFLFLSFVGALGLINGLFWFLVLMVGAWAMMAFHTNDGALANIEESLVAAPLIGPVYRLLFKPVTYYSEDSRLMFQETVQRSVREAIEEIRTAKGLRALTPDELRPTMRDLVK